jgi:hypothetical protein
MPAPANASETEREAHLRALAEDLLFKVSKDADRFTLVRKSDVDEPVIEADLTLDQAEQLLQTWKMRGFHGG